MFLWDSPTSKQHNWSADLGVQTAPWGPKGSPRRNLMEPRSLWGIVLYPSWSSGTFFRERRGQEDWGLAAPEMRGDRNQKETQQALQGHL